MVAQEDPPREDNRVASLLALSPQRHDTRLPRRYRPSDCRNAVRFGGIGCRRHRGFMLDASNSRKPHALHNTSGFI
jgi:hypothetical protein